VILRPILQPAVRPLAAPFGRRPTALTISQLLPAGAGRVAAIYTDPAKPSYDECIAKNMAAIAAGRPQDCVLFSALGVPVTYPIGAGQGKYLLKDRSGGGHDQLQVTASARGEFSRRYNQLLATEDFTNAAWQKRNGATVVANAAISPAGTLTASKLVPGAGVFGGVGSDHSNIFAAPGVASLVAGITYTLSVYAKAGELSVITLYLDPNSPTYIKADLTTGTILDNVGSIPGTIDYVGDGWYRLAITDLATATNTTGVVRIAADTPSGDGTSGIYIWGADLRLSADAIPSIPAYQRVTTASDYDETGFPTYWRAQTDDWAKSHMNPNGATKACVFWAGQQLSGAAAQPIVEASSAPASNTGVFGIYSYGPGFNVRSKGTLDSISGSGSGGHTGIRSVCVGRGDIPNDVASLNVNGVQAVLLTVDQGTGTYIEHDVFFGARGGTAYFANIREYAPPLILLLQPTDSLSATHITKLQKGYAKAAGVTL